MIDAIFEKGFCDCLVKILCSYEKEDVTEHTGISYEDKALKYAQKVDMANKQGRC